MFIKLYHSCQCLLATSGLVLSVSMRAIVSIIMFVKSFFMQSSPASPIFDWMIKIMFLWYRTVGLRYGTVRYENRDW